MNKKKIITFSLIAIFAIAIVFMGSKVIVKAMEKNRNSNTTISDLEQKYAQKISQEKDANALMQGGYRLLKGNQLNCALINFKQVTNLEKSYRDGWLYLGIAMLKNNDPQSALDALKTAEELDPINPQTYQYLATAYKLTDNQEAAQKAQEKYDYLAKQK